MKAYVFALLAILLWSTLAVCGLALSGVPPFLLIGVALLIGSLCGLRWIRHWRVPLRVLLIGLYGIFGYHFFLFMALRSAPPVEANLLNYLWPLLVVLLSPVFLRGYSLRPQHFLAGLLGFSGAVLIVTGGKFSFDGFHFGYVFAALAAFMWASYSLLCKRVPFPTAAIGLFCLISGGLALLCHVVLEPSYRLNAHEISLLLVLGLGPMGAAFFLWDLAFKSGDPRKIGSLSYLTPLLSTLLLVSSGHAAFTWVSAVAMTLILAGALLGSLWPNSRQNPLA